MLMELGNLTRVTTAVLEALDAAFQVLIENEMQSVPTWHRRFFADIPSTDLAIAVKLITAPLKLNKWDTERIVQNIGKRVKTAILEELECTVGVERRDVLYASMRAQLPRVLAGITKVEPNWIIEKLHDYLANGHGTGADYQGIDQVPIFSASHPISKKFVSGGVQQNYWNDLDLNATNIRIVRTAMKAYKGENGNGMDVDPNILWHSPNLQGTAEDLIKKNPLAGGEGNVLYNAFELVEIKGLSTDYLWGLYDDRHASKPFGFMHAIKGAMRWITQPGDEHKEGKYGYEEDAGTTPLMWWAISKCVHTP